MAYRTTTARVERDQQLREHILACAHAQVAAGGFAALTMQGLAAEAGIATGSLYRHFSRKGELASEVFARASQREVDARWASSAGWQQAAILNTASMGWFSSDRTIREYAEDIWNVPVR